jgi:hypothetical protein
MIRDLIFIVTKKGIPSVYFEAIKKSDIQSGGADKLSEEKEQQSFFKNIKVSHSFTSQSTTQTFDYSLMKLVEARCTNSKLKIDEETNIKKLRLKER